MFFFLSCIDGGNVAEVGKQVVSLGLIDALTKYGAKKMAAHMAKGMKHGVRVCVCVCVCVCVHLSLPFSMCSLVQKLVQ